MDLGILLGRVATSISSESTSTRSFARPRPPHRPGCATSSSASTSVSRARVGQAGTIGDLAQMLDIPPGFPRADYRTVQRLRLSRYRRGFREGQPASMTNTLGTHPEGAPGRRSERSGNLRTLPRGSTTVPWAPVAAPRPVNGRRSWTAPGIPSMGCMPQETQQATRSAPCIRCGRPTWALLDMGIRGRPTREQEREV
jgi:hypothetical protein